MVSVPVSIGYGLFAFAPLGPAYFGAGVTAGLYCALFMALTAMAMGARSHIIYGPRNVVSFMINALVLHVLIETHGELLTTLAPERIVSMVLMFGLLAGMMQIAFGWLRLGRAVKYVPHPVIAGFQSTAALVLILGQSDAVMGFTDHVRLSMLPWHLSRIDPTAVAVAAITVVACLVRPRALSRVPSLLVGGVVGSLCYHGLHLMLPALPAGPTIGAVPGGLPLPTHVFDFWWLLTAEQTRSLLPAMVTGAASVALIGSLDALLSAKAVAGNDQRALDGNRELVRIGAGNLVGACFGAIPGAVALATSLASQRAGARTALAGVVQVSVVLLVVVLLGDVLALIPRSVIGGLLVVVGLGLFDRWTMRLLACALRGQLRPLGRAWRELSVVISFAAIAISLDIITAVATGVAVSVVYFIVHMSRSVIRRSYRCDHVRSRRRRPPADEAALARTGSAIVVFELEGSIFFGTAENLANRLEAACQQNVTFIVLDLSRVTEIDLTGARILTRVSDLLTGDGHHLLIAGLTRDGALDRYLDAAGTRAAVTSERVFPDTDRALEWAEDRLLIAESASRAPVAAGDMVDQTALGRLDLFRDLDATQLATVGATLSLRRFVRGELLFTQGDPGDALYVVVAGTASVWLRERTVRLITFSPGTVVGELALIDRAPRSATVVADTDLVCLALTVEAFERLATEAPAISIAVAGNLGRELAIRLRRANRTVLELNR